MSRAKILGALARAVTDTPAREAAAPVAERATRSIMPAPQRFFDPADQDYKPFLRDFEFQPGGRYLEMRRGEAPRDVSGESVDAARISVGPDGRPSMMVGSPTDLPTGSPGKGSSKTKTNLFKRSAGWNWVEAPEGYADIPTLVSVHNRGKHYYALSAEYPKGVDLTRYPKEKSEPRLRPTTQGNVEMGNRVGTIRIRKKEHPVYDMVTVRSMAPIGGLGAAAAAAPEEDDEAEGYSAGGKVVSALARALGREAPEAAPAMRGYHGSPHDFAAERLIQRPSGETEYLVGRPDVLPDVPQGATVLEDFPLGRFRSDKIGTGEGNQAYGHGPYLAEAEGVAQEYRRALAPLGTRAARHNADAEGMAARLLDSGATPEEAIAELQYRLSLPHVTQGLASGDPVVLEFVERANRAQELLRQPNGRMYEAEVRASPDSMLEWDTPFLRQSEEVQQRLRDAQRAGLRFTYPADVPRAQREDPAGPLGSMLYRGLAQTGGGPEVASSALRDVAGIPGIRYLDARSREAGEGTSNLVIFDENLIRIVRKYGIAGLAAALGISRAEAAALAAGEGIEEQPEPGYAMGGTVDVDEANPNYAGDDGMTAMDRSLGSVANPQRLATGGRARSGPPPARPPVPPEQLREIFADLERRYDLPEGYLARVRTIESSDGTRLFNPRSRAAGPFQFIPRTARAMGLTDPYDEAASAEAAARLAAENARSLRRAGFEIDAPTLYLAHQQGATGAVSLLQGNRPATEIVGRNAVVWNGGDPNMSGPQFAGRVFDYFRGQPATTPATPAAAPAPPPTPAPVVAAAPAPAQAPQQPAPLPQLQAPIPFPPPPAPPVPQRRADAPERAMRDVMSSLEMQGPRENPMAPIERHLQMVQAGQRRYATPMPEPEQPVATMAQGGLARMLGSMGRGNDSLVAHITPREALALKAMGGSGTTNPHTGLLEFDDGGGDGGGGDGGGGDGADGGGSDSGGGDADGAGAGVGDAGFGGMGDDGFGGGPDGSFGGAGFGGMADDGFGGGPEGSFGGAFGDAIGSGFGPESPGYGSPGLDSLSDDGFGGGAMGSFGSTFGDAFGDAFGGGYNDGTGGDGGSSPAPSVPFMAPAPVAAPAEAATAAAPSAVNFSRTFVGPQGDLSRYGFGGEQALYRQGYAEGGRVSEPLSYEAQRFLDLIREADLEASAGGIFTPIPTGRVVAGGANARAAVPVGREGAALDLSAGHQAVSASGRGFRSNQNRLTGAGVGYTMPDGGRLSLDYHDRMMGEPDTLPGADPIELTNRPAPSRGLRLGYRREF